MLKGTKAVPSCVFALLVGLACHDLVSPIPSRSNALTPFPNVADENNVNLLTCRTKLPPQLTRDDLIEVHPTFIPFYARIERAWPTGIPADETYGAVYFYYRNPSETIPPDFNLLDFFDPRLNDPAFGEALGLQLAAPFTIWLVPGVPLPWFTSASGGEVEFWIVTRDQVDDVVSDDLVTIAELENLNPPPLRGVASKFCEEVRPFPGVTHFLNTFAKGRLEDGRKFKVEIHTQNLTSSTPDPQIFDIDVSVRPKSE